MESVVKDTTSDFLDNVTGYFVLLEKVITKDRWSLHHCIFVFQRHTSLLWLLQLTRKCVNSAVFNTLGRIDVSEREPGEEAVMFLLPFLVIPNKKMCNAPNH